MNVYLVIILAILIGDYLLDLIVEILNVRCASVVLPKEFVGFYDAQKYKKSQNYLKDNTVFGLITSDKASIMSSWILFIPDVVICTTKIS